MDDLNGILLIDKPKGITSYDVIRRLKGYFPRKYKLGHGGTLDPFAEGLLIILVGKGTKLMEKIHKLNKTYRFKIEFGNETDTQDITGTVIRRDTKVIGEEEVESMMDSFIGTYDQIPPIFSAKKIKGVPAYKYARAGEDKQLEPKSVNILSFKMLSYEWPTVECEATVSSGTYIRKLTVDLAHRLGTVGNTVELVRTDIGEFKLTDSIPIDTLESDLIRQRLISLDKLDEYF